MANNDNNGNSFTLGFLLGGIIGAIVGVRLAPKSGAETRADLAVRSEELRDKAEDLAATVRERVGPAMETVRERMGPVVDDVSARIRHGSSPNDKTQT